MCFWENVRQNEYFERVFGKMSGKTSILNVFLGVFGKMSGKTSILSVFLEKCPTKRVF